MRVIGVPAGALDLDDPHRVGWQRALAHAASVARLVPVDVSALLAAGRLLYDGPFVAERLSAFGQLLHPDGPHLDPTVRGIVLRATTLTAADVFDGLHRLAELRRLAEAVFVSADAVLLPVTPGHPTIAEVAADPVGVSSRLGTYTNMVNLLDLCAVAVPAGERPDGLPFGVQLLAPAFADAPLLDLAARWCGEPTAAGPAPAHDALPHRGPVELDDGAVVTGFLAEPAGLGPAEDITRYGGWRAYLADGHPPG
jgi:allophanate hydrolase